MALQRMGGAVEAIHQVGFSVAKDYNGNTMDILAPFLQQPVHVSINDSFIFVIPSQNVQITCEINLHPR
ncbi:hypothetical protein FRX31_010581 [Thalictrum thalictroides]|uniref:Uncharacterized protein n=1 Tax=Thalictrum thalictroides TaxID=46969 RepID=A0A7J6WT62_THATH|nr:hypothetical protein FRX31_010581 [Thalictrum thalictroides]